MKFKVGDRVVANPEFEGPQPDFLENNRVMTVDRIDLLEIGFVQRLRLKECNSMGWYSSERFKLYEEPKSKPHKWAKEIKAWADGAEIEYRVVTAAGGWSPWCFAGKTPSWTNNSTFEYRIKPEKKPDLVLTRKLTQNTDGLALFAVGSVDWLPELGNLKLTLDGETGKLKAVELLA